MSLKLTDEQMIATIRKVYGERRVVGEDTISNHRRLIAHALSLLGVVELAKADARALARAYRNSRNANSGWNTWEEISPGCQDEETQVMQRFADNHWPKAVACPPVVLPTREEIERLLTGVVKGQYSAVAITDAILALFARSAGAADSRPDVATASKTMAICRHCKQRLGPFDSADLASSAMEEHSKTCGGCVKCTVEVAALKQQLAESAKREAELAARVETLRNSVSCVYCETKLGKFGSHDAAVKAANGHAATCAKHPARAVVELKKQLAEMETLRRRLEECSETNRLTWRALRKIESLPPPPLSINNAVEYVCDKLAAAEANLAAMQTPASPTDPERCRKLAESYGKIEAGVFGYTASKLVNELINAKSIQVMSQFLAENHLVPSEPKVVKVKASELAKVVAKAFGITQEGRVDMLNVAFAVANFLDIALEPESRSLEEMLDALDKDAAAVFNATDQKTREAISCGMHETIKEAKAVAAKGGA